MKFIQQIFFCTLFLIIFFACDENGQIPQDLSQDINSTLTQIETTIQNNTENNTQPSSESLTPTQNSTNTSTPSNIDTTSLTPIVSTPISNTSLINVPNKNTSNTQASTTSNKDLPIDSELSQIPCSEIELMPSYKTIENTDPFILNIQWHPESIIQPIDIFWRDFDGNEVIYGSLNDSTYVRSYETYIGHPWVLRDASSSCVTGFIIDESDVISNKQTFYANVFIEGNNEQTSTIIQTPATIALPTPTTIALPTPTALPSIPCIDSEKQIQVTVNTSQTGKIDCPRDSDIWILDAGVNLFNQSVNISITTSNNSSDTYLELISPSNIYVTDDDSGGNMNPLLSNVLINERGEYQIVVTALDDNLSDYTLKVDSIQLTPTPTATPTPSPTPTPTPTPVPNQTGFNSNTLPHSVSYAGRSTTWNQVNLNNSGSNVITVTPGQQVTADISMNYTHATYCPGCIVQFYVKIPDTFEDCLRSGGTQGGGNINKTVSFNAPNEPGIYYMQFGGSLQYSCTGASVNSEFGDSSVATIIVAQSNSLPHSVSYAGRSTTWNQVNLNNSGSNVITVNPGAAMTADISMTYTHATYCPGCIVQFYVKIPNTFENCLRSGGTQGGGNVNKTVSFNAPNEPGIYYMQFGGSLQYSCTGASVNSEFGDSSVATLVVKNN